MGHPAPGSGCDIITAQCSQEEHSADETQVTQEQERGAPLQSRASLALVSTLGRRGFRTMSYGDASPSARGWVRGEHTTVRDQQGLRSRHTWALAGGSKERPEPSTVLGTAALLLPSQAMLPLQPQPHAAQAILFPRPGATSVRGLPNPRRGRVPQSSDDPPPSGQSRTSVWSGDSRTPTQHFGAERGNKFCSFLFLFY